MEMHLREALNEPLVRFGDFLRVLPPPPVTLEGAPALWSDIQPSSYSSCPISLSSVCFPSCEDVVSACPFWSPLMTILPGLTSRL